MESGRAHERCCFGVRLERAVSCEEGRSQVTTKKIFIKGPGVATTPVMQTVWQEVSERNINTAAWWVLDWSHVRQSWCRWKKATPRAAHKHWPTFSDCASLIPFLTSSPCVLVPLIKDSVVEEMQGERSRALARLTKRTVLASETSF